MGGEDFAWYLEEVPGALARLGVRRPTGDAAFDLHQGTFDIDENALDVGVRYTVALAYAALRTSTEPSGKTEHRASSIVLTTLDAWQIAASTVRGAPVD